MSDEPTIDEQNKVREYEGNDGEFKKYNELLNKPFEFKTLYYDKEKKLKKYEGNLIQNNIFEGRGILYDISGNMEYNGFFKKMV